MQAGTRWVGRAYLFVIGLVRWFEFVRSGIVWRTVLQIGGSPVVFQQWQQCYMTRL